jgi:hypothetical protein
MENVKGGPDLILPTVWSDHMDNRMSGKTQTAARHILGLFWGANGRPVYLTNSPLSARGVGRHAKRRAIEDLEGRGLIEVERHRGRPPVIRIPAAWSVGQEIYGVPLSVIRKEYGWKRWKSDPTQQR